ncbi:serine carboxypeptidase [Ancylostoma ceylanicum]|uniref:Serine carboxypeptidase n=1 Tax=Ancylostoma ceylanicum TaxID=53326 RepID=A0A0D6LZF7_9BILA|nr:serine carboxypeptidase [Ancylostoma ceylanicum]
MRLLTFLVLVVADLVSADRTAKATADKITDLPFVSFQTNFEQFAGFLNSTVENELYKMHYWYIESQNASTDPLILYISGAQCSSLYDMMMDVGPFRSYGLDSSLYENVFSWNKVANLLVIDPPGVGYSPGVSEAFDDLKVSAAMESALTNFFTVFPERVSNKFYLAAEGYASVYVMKIAWSILQKLATGQSQTNLQGILIGNGMVSAQTEYNTILPIAYTHAFAGKEVEDTNLYQDCYRQQIGFRDYKASLGLALSNNYDSSDPWNGYPCTGGDSTHEYLTDPGVMAAMHAADSTFLTCAHFPYGTPTTDLTIDLSNVFNHKLYASRNMSILFYNGDLDTQNNFLSAQNFVRDFSAKQKLSVITEDTWRANYYRGVYADTDGGLRTIYSGNLHVLSIRGAGHYTTLSRPAQTLQVVRNFIRGLGYDNCLSAVNLAAAPLLPFYSQTLNPNTTRMQADKACGEPELCLYGSVAAMAQRRSRQ